MSGGRLRKLDIELSPEGVVLHGETSTFHVKQLAQHGVRDLLPTVQPRTRSDPGGGGSFWCGPDRPGW